MTARAVRCCAAWIAALVLALPAPGVEAQSNGERVLRVCADPNNLPYSNAAEEGFENRLAELVAREMGARLEYVWWPQRRGFIRSTLREHACDVVIGVPAAYELVRTTRPYYRSTYVFLSRADRALGLRSLDDPRLRELSIGVHVIGEDYSNSPPAHALGRREIVHNVVGYSVYGDYREPNPPARLAEAVAAGAVDVAIAWGPIAGYFARRSPVPLELTPVTPQIDLPFLPMVYDIAMGVRREDEALGAELDAILERRAAEVRGILEEYGVPVLRTGSRRGP